jgi:hypothetical protein
MAAAGVDVHVVTPYRPNAVISDGDNPIYGIKSKDYKIHSIDTLAICIQKHYAIDVMDIWVQGEGVHGSCVCSQRLFAPLVHFLVDELKTTSTTSVVLYNPQVSDPFTITQPLVRRYEQWTVYDGENVPKACFPVLPSQAERVPYIGQKLTFAVSLTASADPWWVANVATAIRLTQPHASVVALCDMTTEDMVEMTRKLPDSVQPIHCTEDADKCLWYTRVFACLHMGQGEDDQALLDIIGHGVPVITNRCTHHVAILGKAYPLFSLRPDIPSIRACVTRLVSCEDVHKASIAHIRHLQGERYSYESVANSVRRLVCV